MLDAGRRSCFQEVVRGLLLFLCGFALLRETFLLLFE